MIATHSPTITVGTIGHRFIRVEFIPILRDYEPFHRRGGTKVGINGLFSDNHVEAL